MKKLLAALLAVALCASLAVSALAASPFSDVSSDAPYYDAVVWASENGYVNGVGGGKFNPGGNLSRGDFATVLWRYAGAPAVADAPEFSDVAAGVYYADAVAWAVSKNITNGVGNGKYAPKESLTLWQLDIMLQRYETGEIDGITSDEPKTTATRADIVVALKNFGVVPEIITIKGEKYSTSLTVLQLVDIELTNAEIKPLKYMTNLTELRLIRNQISDISPLKGLTNLTTLYLGGNKISDINVLNGLTNLTKLSLSKNQISDIDVLKGLTSLTELYLGGNKISDISVLKDLTGLERLELENNQISDISALKGLTKLVNLRLDNNQISEVNVLKELKNLKSLGLVSNPVTKEQIHELLVALPGCMISSSGIS
ncbi:MAG: leucine-rich repeat domain-containing protein [Oscillospiraceae bacterium]|jgi:hypothetical protein|nr:leucine-rich repeat domain-containing protein [Oscillospiraceae bacterium]